MCRWPVGAIGDYWDLVLCDGYPTINGDRVLWVIIELVGIQHSTAEENKDTHSLKSLTAGLLPTHSALMCAQALPGNMS